MWVRVLLILQQDNHEKTWRDWKYLLELIYFTKGEFMAEMGATGNVSQGIADFTTI